METKKQTSIEELIDECIPNSCGVLIDVKLLPQLWEKKEDVIEFNNYINNKFMKIIGSYNIDNMMLYYNLLLQSQNNEKFIKITEETIINMFLQYFNAPFHNKIIPFFSLEEKESVFDEQINKLKKIIKERIVQLGEINDLEEIKDIMPDLYGHYIYLYEQFYNETKKYIKNEKDKMFLKMRWNETFQKIKETDINNFRKLSLWIKNVIEQLSKPIEPKYFENINIGKLKLYIAKQYLEYAKIFEDKNKLILLDFISREIKKSDNKEISIKNIDFCIYEEELNKENYLYYEYYDNKMLEKEFNEYLEQNPEIKSKLDKLSEYNKEDFSNLNYSEILEYVDMILEDEEIKKEIEVIEEKKLVEELSTLNQEIDEENISEEDRNKLISQKHKLEFLFKECKPYKICKGINTFDGYYGYIYPNGILVLDYINKDPKKSYGNAIYIMPLEKLKDYSNLSKQEIRNKISKNELEDVKYIYHDPKGNWKEKIKSKISNLTSKKLNINYDEIELPFDLKELDKIEEKLSQTNNSLLKNKISKQKEEIIKKSKEIDETIKNNTSITEINNLEREELKQEEQELSSSDYKTFIELFENWLKNNKKEKVKRNSAVSLYTKLRSRDEDGNFRCELCNCAGFSATDFESHHFIPISKNGPDNIYNTVCLCPNCHTNIHNNKITYNQKYNLLMKIKQNIEKYNPEYIEQFNYYFDEILNIYKKTLDSITNIEEEKEYYKKHKEQIEELFKIYYIGRKDENIKHNK